MFKRKKKKDKASKDVMGLSDHLSELRKRLMIVIIVFTIVTLASFNFSDDIVNLLTENAKSLGYQLVYLAPGELFKEYIRLSVICGVTLSSPVILFQIWGFIRPGLTKSENISVFFSLLAGLICFLIGSLFAYYIAVPMMLNFFINVGQTGIVLATISIEKHISFIISTLSTFGIVFEMPVITVLLSQLGLLKPEWMVKSRKVIIVVIFIIGAFITPPDVISQILVAVPMIVLFEISVLISKIISKKKIKREMEIAY